MSISVSRIARSLVGSGLPTTADSDRAATVLVIDDSEKNRQQVASQLRSIGFNVLELGSVMGASRVLARQQVDAVIADASLPGFAGGALVSFLRSHPNCQGLVLLASSEFVSERSDSTQARYC